jgi:excinuclease ABC subunit A
MKQQTIAIQGAREHNLKNISVEIPREQFIVVTGLSGSGKSSLAFDTLFAEGQRRFLESLDAYAKKFASQLKKPDVDFIFGLSPVISIQQKSVNKNPRSTIGTLTDIYDYMRLLYSTIGVGHCPYCDHEVPVKTPYQMMEHVFCLPEGTHVEVCVPVFKIYGEDWSYLLGDIRSKGCRRVLIDGVVHDLSEEIDLDEGRDYRIEAILDKVIIKKHMRDLEKQFLLSIQNALRVGAGFVRFHIVEGVGCRVSSVGKPKQATANRTPKQHNDRHPTPDTQHPDFYAGFACPEHQVTMGELLPFYFSFNEPDSWCVTCSGLGVYRHVHPDLLLPDKTRSIKGGAFIPEAFKYDKNMWAGRLMYSLAAHYGFSLDTPFCDLPPEIVDTILYGSKGERFPLLLPPGGDPQGSGKNHIGQMFRYDGIITDIERRYRRYRKEKIANTWMEEYLKRVMVEHTCPDCKGVKLKPQRMCVKINGKNIYELGDMPIDDLAAFLQSVEVFGRQQQAGEHIQREIVNRLQLLLDIGLDYLSLNRKAATLSGGESQRTRLSTQISSGLMGMMYVLDEPSIGLHPKDNQKLISTLKRLRDIGNTVIVVEHDEETIRAADFLVEMGPGPGVHGGEVVTTGTPEEVLAHPNSPTALYLSGRKRIPVPTERRKPNGKTLVVRGARQNNLQNLDVEIPLGVFITVTGASGSGKSTLVNDILYKKLYSVLHDSRVLAGDHDGIENIHNIHDVIEIDQTPLGRTPRSNPATYIGFYDEIRRLFMEQPAAQARGYTAARFSFNLRGGRCEECNGEGLITTNLFFMPEVESPCPACNGARYNAETLEIRLAGKSISDVLNMTFEEAACFFQNNSLIRHKVGVVNELGLGYLTLGQSATTLSGGEAQRVKLANELGKIKRGGSNLYILDEPTTGLHIADIHRLLDSLYRLVDAGNTVLVIEHHLDVIKCADYVIDLGPEGGRHGGEIVVQGTPEEVAACPHSHTGRFLRNVL